MESEKILQFIEFKSISTLLFHREIMLKQQTCVHYIRFNLYFTTVRKCPLPDAVIIGNLSRFRLVQYY